MIAITY